MKLIQSAYSVAPVGAGMMAMMFAGPDYYENLLLLNSIWFQLTRLVLVLVVRLRFEH